jgi:hypothetical protein
MKRSSNGDSVSLSFIDFITGDTSDLSLFDQPMVKVVFSVKALTHFGSEVKLCGSLKELGNWDPNNAVSFKTSSQSYPTWTSNPVTISLQSVPFTFEYKYIMINNNTKSIKWESFSKNRISTIRDRCSFWNFYQITDNFNTHSSPELSLSSTSPLVAQIKEITKGQPFELTLESLAFILETNPIDLTLIHMIAIALKSISGNIKEMISTFSITISNCMKILTIQQTKMILSFINLSELELIKPSDRLVDFADIYENSSQNDDEDFIVAYNLSALRSSIYMECRSVKNSVTLMLTDNNLEKKEMELIDKILENIEDKESIWKITLVGKWICEMLFYHSISSKHLHILKNQFEKLEKHENIEVLKDLLYELMNLVIEEYCNIVGNTNHNDCESLAKSLNVEYVLIYYNLFTLASRFILKSIPLVKKCLNIPPYVCYSSGCVTGQLFNYNCDTSKIPPNSILLINKPDEYIDFTDSISGIVVGSTNSLLVPLLVTGKLMKVPITIGFIPPFDSAEYTLMSSEDCCNLSQNS